MTPISALDLARAVLYEIEGSNNRALAVQKLHELVDLLADQVETEETRVSDAPVAARGRRTPRDHDRG